MRTIAELAALVVDDDPDLVAESFDRPAARCPGPNADDAATSNRSSTRVADLLACWPPGPPDALNDTCELVTRDRAPSSCHDQIVVHHLSLPRWHPWEISSWAIRPATGRRARRPDALEAVQEADRLGFDSFWTAEAYGSDVSDPARVVGSPHRADQARHVDRADVGADAGRDGDGRDHDRPPVRWPRSSSDSARPGPQVVEGWYGEPYPRPLERTREYVADRARDHPPRASRRVPRPALRPALHRRRRHGHRQGAQVHGAPAPQRDPDLPRRRGPEERVARRPRSATAGSRCSSPRRTTPGTASGSQTGFDASGDAGKADRFEVASMLTIIPGDDVEQCADLMRPMHRAVRRRDGRQGRQLPLRRVRPHGLGGRRARRSRSCTCEGKKQEAAALDPARDGRGRRARRPARQDPRRPREVEGDLPHHRAAVGKRDQLEMLADLVNG